MLPDHEAFATGVDELAAFAAYGLADQRQLAPGARTEVEHCRVELDELDVPQPRPGAQRAATPSPVETGGFVVTA